MNAVRICRKLESDTLYLPEIRPLIGKNVEIIVQEDSAGCFRDLAPWTPTGKDEREALRALLTPDQFDALMDVADRGGPDVDAIARMRAASMT